MEIVQISLKKTQLAEMEKISILRQSTPILAS